MTLENVLESARILTQAKSTAKRSFGRWLREEGRMDPTTARHHFRVAAFVQANRGLTPDFASLSLAKVYALCTLDFARAKRFLTGEERFSAPLAELTDIQFRQEFRQRFPGRPKRRTRHHVYQEIMAAIARLKKALARGNRFAKKLTPLQRTKMGRELETLVKMAEEWRLVA